ncbi:hypothetical protein EDD36DRAFT_250921 [Exophiala viscosa]|uniref:NAD-dependent epimerase/dehydratase domain-containing protein n=1 Tax=Exophiala viscosa TaxID=2486360 RepID=A0AAN6ID06_9EURO|nr:hypothetical protein EDD36DRAFT_250921 [Exophiala viscosa]
MKMTTALVLGCTGVVGSHILSTLRHSAPQFSSIDIVARRPAPTVSEATVPVKELVEKDTTKWGPYITSLSPPPSILFYALATTRAAAGGFDNQYKFEHEMNTELAKAAKEAGIKTYVLISSTGAHPKSFFGYPRMKGKIEEYVKGLGFEHTIIVRPGLIVAKREKSGLDETVLKYVATALGHVHSSLKDAWAQDADTIAKAAVSAALKAEQGEATDKVWILAQKDIVRLGKTEYKAAS